MDTMLNPDNFDAPCLYFSDLPDGMGDKLEVGDTIIAKEGDTETTAEVIEVDKANEAVYLSKELPTNAEYTVKESATGATAPYDAMRKEAAMGDKDQEHKSPVSKDDLTGPLPNLKKLLIQISIQEGDCND